VKSPLWSVLLIVLAAWSPKALAAVEADAGAPPTDLAALLDEASRNSPLLRAADARVEAARAVPSQAQALPDPEAGIGYTNMGLSHFTLGEDDDAFVTLSWKQELPYPGKRRAGGDVAARRVDVSGRERDRARREVYAAVKSAYADLYRLRATEEILAETRRTLESLTDAARRRYEAGMGAQESILKSATEVVRLETDETRVSEERRSTEVRLAGILGRTSSLALGPALTLPAVEPTVDPEAAAAAAAEGAPEVLVLQASVHEAEAALRVAQLGLRPDFVWSASYDYRGDIEPMVGAMLGIRLPVYRRTKQTQAVSQAEFDLAAARRLLEEAGARLRGEALERVARFQRADRLVTIVGQDLIPQARLTLDSALASYGVGRVEFLDILFDLKTLLEARVDLIAEETERFRAATGLEALTGQPLISVRNPDVQ
jgi:outer membrane protein, heavy metal efflux system